MHHRCGDQLGLNKNRFEESSPKRIRLADEYSKRVIRRQSTIFDLPVEVLARIFEYLLVRERGNVRLVCRRWCEIFDETAKLVEGEKLICCDLYRTTDPSQDILRTLARSKRAILNIEFHYFEFRESDSTFWQQCGPKIRALHFSECSMSADTLARVVLHCPNLTHISWCVENVKKEKMAFCPAETMDRLLSYRVTNANLISLGIRCVRACGLSNFILGALFALFPNIKKLAFCFTAFERSDDQDEDVDEESVAGSRTRLTIGYVLRQIAALENVAERLDVALKYRHDRRNVSWDRIVSTCEFGRLRQVTLDVASENAQLNTVFAFLANQPCLEAVRLRGIPASPEPSFSESCAHMLDRCPKLRHLRVESRALSLSGAWLLRIVESRLTTLCVRTAKLRIDPEFRCRPGSQCRVNTRLRTLVLDGDVGETAQLAFVDTFRRLHTLELHAVTDKVLQSVCKYQVELVSLKLWRACYTTDYGFTGIRSGGNVETIASGGETIYSARRLQNLEYLSIESSEDEWPITNDTFAEFVFPKLRYFVLDVCINGELHDRLLDATSKLRSLQVLSFKVLRAPFSKCYDICAKLTNLRYLRCRDDSENARRFTDSQYQRLFTRRSSLRAVVYECNESTNSTYFFHVVEKKSKKKITGRLHRLPSEKIGISFVDCLWF